MTRINDWIICQRNIRDLEKAHAALSRICNFALFIEYECKRIYDSVSANLSKNIHVRLRVLCLHDIFGVEQQNADKKFMLCQSQKALVSFGIGWSNWTMLKF